MTYGAVTCGNSCVCLRGYLHAEKMFASTSIIMDIIKEKAIALTHSPVLVNIFGRFKCVNITEVMQLHSFWAGGRKVISQDSP